jgi:hypothetical protein
MPYTYVYIHEIWKGCHVLHHSREKFRITGYKACACMQKNKNKCHRTTQEIRTTQNFRHAWSSDGERGIMGNMYLSAALCDAPTKDEATFMREDGVKASPLMWGMTMYPDEGGSMAMPETHD